MLKRIKIKIQNIHCKSCKVLIETELDVLAGVRDVDVDHKTGICKIEFDNTKISKQKIFKAINKLGYKIDLSKTRKKQKSKFDMLTILGVGIAIFIGGYLLIQHYGALEIMSKLNEENIGYWLIFLIGLLASFHCIGMCGGLVVTYTAGHQSKAKSKISISSPHLQYNLGRIVSYTAVGAVLGGVGSFFGVNPVFTGIITLIAGGFMVLMGFSLLTHFKFLEKIKLRMPSFIARFLYNQKHTRKPKGPFIIGILSGFMPCGPLQAMQLYALASGSITRGALSMMIYAAGTVPLMFGFGSFISLISKDRIKQVMKISGAVVIILGILMFNRGLINFGYGFRSFIPSSGTSQTEYLVKGDVEEYQVVNMDLTYRGYSPNVIYIKKDIPVRWIINVAQMSGCTDEIILPQYNIKKPLEYGKNIIEFVPDKLGDIKFSCWMQMVWGKFVVTKSDVNPSQKQLELESVELPTGNCTADNSCGKSSCQVAQGKGCGCSRIRSK
ncbi:hypothetical protein CL633_01030 [bacterium]|nr:hypothetical protein [bacterium]